MNYEWHIHCAKRRHSRAIQPDTSTLPFYSAMEFNAFFHVSIQEVNRPFDFLCLFVFFKDGNNLLGMGLNCCLCFFWKTVNPLYTGKGGGIPLREIEFCCGFARQSLGGSFLCRITSYNVCYTKLLRATAQRPAKYAGNS